MRLGVHPVNAIEAALCGVDAAGVRLLVTRGCRPELAVAILLPDAPAERLARSPAEATDRRILAPPMARRIAARVASRTVSRRAAADDEDVALPGSEEPSMCLREHDAAHNRGGKSRNLHTGAITGRKLFAEERKSRGDR